MNELITVYSAEVMRRLRSRTFMLGLLFGILGVAAALEIPRFVVSYTEANNRLLLSGDPQLVASARSLLRKDFAVAGTRNGTAAPSLEELRSHNASALLLIVREARGIRLTVYARDPGEISTARLQRDLVPLNLQIAAHLPAARVTDLMHIPIRTQAIASKFGTAAQSDAAKAIAYVLLLLLYILIMVNSQLIMSSVAEEKTSRIAELLVASVDPSALLAGKVLASATLAVVQMIIWVGIAYALGVQPQASGAGPASVDEANFSLNGVSALDIAAFVLFFLIGFLQTSTLFAAFGSLINRTEDLGSLSGPLFLPVIAAFIFGVSALALPDKPAVVTASFVPLIAPFVMFARIAVSTVPVWQIASSLAINIAAIAAIAVVGGRIYRVGMLLYGRPPRPSQIWHAITAR